MHKNIETALAEKRNLLEPEAMELFRDYGLPVPDYIFAATREAAVEGAVKMGFPVALKVVSPDIIHKSDAGGVKLNLSDPGQAGLAYDQILSNARKYNADALIKGVLVVRQAQKDTECIVGAIKDNQFGHCIMFGLGGVAVELYKDVSFRVLPLTQADAREVISETKASKLLKGYRGSSPKDVNAITDVLLSISHMLEENPEIKELDINPLMVYEHGVLVIDGRVML